MTPKQFEFSYGGQGFPDKIKVKKTLFKVYPLEFIASCAIDCHNGYISPKLCAKDSLLKGKVEVNLPARAIEYKKRFYLPLGFIGTCCIFGTARWCWETPEIRPRFYCGVELCNWARLLRPLSFNLKPTIPVTDHIGIKATSRLTFRLPSQLHLLRDDSAGSGGGGGSRRYSGDGGEDGDNELLDFGAKLHVSRLDLTITL